MSCKNHGSRAKKSTAIDIWSYADQAVMDAALLELSIIQSRVKEEVSKLGKIRTWSLPDDYKPRIHTITATLE